MEITIKLAFMKIKEVKQYRLNSKTLVKLDRTRN